MKKMIAIIVAMFMMIGLTACEGTGETGLEKQNEEESQVIYEDDILKAVYKGVSETSGVVIMTVELYNKTDGEISVLPMNSSVDGKAVQFTSGTLATIQGGKEFNQGWIVGSMPTENVEFSMSICDENMSELEQTDIITVEISDL